MKKILRIFVLMAVVSLFAVTKSKAQISISLQLARPAQYEQNERVHPPRPTPNHIWVAEEWAPNGRGSYDYVPGHWNLPPKIGWGAGRWVQQGGGYVWVPGHWNVLINGQWLTLRY